MTSSEPPTGAGPALGSGVPGDVGQAAPDDGVPADVRRAAHAAFAAFDRRAQVAELTADEVVDGATRLAFRYAGTTLDVDVRAGEVRVRVVPQADGDVCLELPGGPSLVLERDGEVHVLRHVPQGPVALVLEVGGQRCRTAWSRL